MLCNEYVRYYKDVKRWKGNLKGDGGGGGGRVGLPKKELFINCHVAISVKQKPMKEDKKGLEEACSNCEGVDCMVFCYKVIQLNIL